jgi:hypothetical protein
MFSKYFIEAFIDAGAHDAATSPTNDLPDPTEAQKKAGNYKKGHIRFKGLDISIENPVGSYRSGVDKNGKQWKSKLFHHYGYINNSGRLGKDGDPIDCFIGPDHDSDIIFIVNQKNKESEFDEHKCLIGFSNYTDAIQGYLKNYEPGWERQGLLGSIYMTDIDNFKEWLKNGNLTKPYTDLS